MTSARNYYKALQGLPKPIKGLDPKKKAATVQPGVVTLIGLFPGLTARERCSLPAQSIIL